MKYKFKFTCDLCGDQYEENHSCKNNIRHCPKCRLYLGIYRQELANNYLETMRYKKRYRETGIREYVCEAKRNEAKNHGPADNCPENCFYSRYCGIVRDCEYLIYEKKCLPFDGTEFSKNCSCYVRATPKQKLESSREQLDNAEYGSWYKVLSHIKI